MKKIVLFIVLILFMLSGCAATLSSTSPDGTILTLVRRFLVR